MDEYTPRMIALYGLKRLEEFWQLKRTVVRYTHSDYESLYQTYKEDYEDALLNN